MGRGCKRFEVLDRKTECLEEIVGRNMNIKGNSSDSSEIREASYRESFCHLRDYT